MWIKLQNAWYLWRVRPGLELAARWAEQEAYNHPAARLLGPEMNLLRFSNTLKNAAKIIDRRLKGLRTSALYSKDAQSKEKNTNG